MKLPLGETSMKKQLIMFVCMAAFAATAIGGISGGASPRSNSSQLLLVGPVDALLARENAIVVLGQKIQVSAGSSFVAGDLVAVYGRFENARLSVSRIERSGPYVAGATAVLLTGVVQKLHTSVGRAVVSGVSVDLTSLVSTDGSQVAPALGSIVQIAGIQPVKGGVVLVDGINGGAAEGISGGASKGISGGASKGISGGASQGISGGAAQGISGGAAQGISGGALKGISGGASKGISGGASKGISGGASLGISGGAAQGISGGAAQGISGGAAEGISGGASKGISGGASKGISGGASLGISGGAAQGISGGAAQGISGGASL
jgi:hypothetical protein